MGYTLHKKLVTRFQFGNKRQSFVHIKKLFSQMQIYIYSIGVLTVNILDMWLINGVKTNSSDSFHPFRAEPHTFHIYRQYTNIVFILQ